MAKLAYFPPPAKDATVYSLLASANRLHGTNRLLEDLIGGQNRFARPLWPDQLEAIAACLPDCLEISGEDLYDQHTLAPAYTPLMTSSRALALKEAMLRQCTTTICSMSGAHNICLVQPMTLLVCPQCLREKPHYLRFHQLPGVVVCPLHPDQVLHVTSVERSPTRHRRMHVDVRDTEVGSPVSILRRPETFARAFSVASQMRSMLERPLASPGPEQFRLYVREALRERGFGASFGKLKSNDVSQAFTAWLGHDLPAIVGLADDHGRPNTRWFLDLLVARRTAIHPLWAVLISLFLERSISQTLAAAAVFKPPEMPQSTPMHRGISVAHARMEAGCKKLPRLWQDKTLSVRAIARRLKVSDITVIRWAAFSNLPFPRQGPTKVTHRPRQRGTLPAFKIRVQQYRKRWLEAKRALNHSQGIAHHPLSQKLYAWLNRYDPAWHKKHLPKLKRRGNTTELDKQIARDVVTTAAAIKSSSKLIRASESRILLWLRRPGIAAEKHKWHRTAQALQAQGESHEDYVVRRLLWLHENGKLSKRALTTALRKRPHLKQLPSLAPLLQTS